MRMARSGGFIDRGAPRYTRRVVPLKAIVLASLLQPGPPAHRFGLQRPRPPEPGTIRLATYNVLNLFDRADDPRLSGERDDMKLAIDEERAVALAGAIRALDADVIGLQEVESLEALAWFRDTYLPHAGYLHLASFDAGDDFGIECSLMSRLEITSARVRDDASLEGVRREGPGWAPLPEGSPGRRFQRAPLEARVRTPSGYALTILVVHHKAGRDFDFQRESESLRVVQIVAEHSSGDPGANVVVMGDFNAAPWDKSMRVYLEAGMVDTLAHRAVRGPEAPLYKTHESGRVVDYILLNGPAYRELVAASPHVYGTPAPPESHERAREPSPRGYASDHYPVAIDLVPVDRR